MCMHIGTYVYLLYHLLRNKCDQRLKNDGTLTMSIPVHVQGAKASQSVLLLYSSKLKQLCDKLNSPEVIQHKRFFPEDTNIFLPQG